MSTMVVRAGDTAVAQGINDLPVLSSGAAISAIESACSAALAEFFEAGETSHTIKIALEMNTSVPIGDEIRVTARLVEHEGDLVLFEAELTHQNRTIAAAQVQRRLIDRISFMARIAAQRLVN